MLQSRLPLPADEDNLWQAVIERDRTRDGTFYYAVASTGVYCKPSCPSRLARRNRVSFHATPAEAERAGFRPCKRCRPNEPASVSPDVARIAAACRLIEDAEAPPCLNELAAASGLSPHHFHRLFKKTLGLTPKAYAAAIRDQRLRHSLNTQHTITAAIHEAGFGSSSRFYEKSNETLGMTPQDYRRGGNQTSIRFAVGQCTLGAILVAATDKGIASITLGDDPEELVRYLQDQFPDANLIGDDNAFSSTVATVVAFVENPHIGLDLPLDIQGTAFQQRVWQALRHIPAGTTVTYTELAEHIGKPAAVRAVASACAANKIAVAVPCHRVVHKGGSHAGYRWGIARKDALIAREAKLKTR